MTLSHFYLQLQVKLAILTRAHLTNSENCIWFKFRRARMEKNIRFTLLQVTFIWNYLCYSSRRIRRLFVIVKTLEICGVGEIDAWDGSSNFSLRRKTNKRHTNMFISWLNLIWHRHRQILPFNERSRGELFWTLSLRKSLNKGGCKIRFFQHKKIEEDSRLDYISYDDIVV